MPRPLSIALLAILFLAKPCLADDKPPPAVKPIVEKAVREVRKNRQEFDKANEKPLGEAKKALEELSTKLIKDGKAEEAGVVLKQIGTLEKEVLSKANAPAPAGGAGPQKPLLERLAGKWTHPNHPTIFQIEPNGEMREVWKSDGKVLQQGRLEATAEGTAGGVWGAGKCLIREAGVDALAMEHWEPTGKPWNVGIVLTRIK